MNRRTLMKSAASGAVGACLLGGMTDNAMNARAAASPAKPHTGDFIETADGVKLAYTDWGSGNPVVFIHAWALPSPMWDYQIGALSQAGLRCIAYDRRGHGRSSRPGSGYDCDTLADDLSALLTQLDLHGVTLVSHSFGSGEVVRYLTRHGAGRIEKIVLIAPAALPFVTKTPDNPDGIPAETLEFFRSHVLQADFPKWLEDGRQAFFVADTSQSLQEWVKQLMLSTPLPVAIETNRRITSTDFRHELPGIAVPTLIIHGDNDVSAPIDLTGRPTAALIPKAQLRVYEGAPHGLFLTHKDRLNADLLGFIRGRLEQGSRPWRCCGRRSRRRALRGRALISRNAAFAVGPRLAAVFGLRPKALRLACFPRGESTMKKVPNLSISPEKVFFIIAKSRQSESSAAGLNLESDSDDDMPENHSQRSDRSELSGFIRGLNEDEQIDLVALMWLGRGDGNLDNWRDLRGEASRAHNNRTASYLLGTPMLADYLEEALSAFGMSSEDFEEHL